MRRTKVAALGAALLAAAGLGLVSTGPAAASTTTAAASCQFTFHARPTTMGWKSDPCAQFDIADGFTTRAVRVQHFWSMAGGAHIEDIRGTYTICNDNPATVVRVSADAVALHRSDGTVFSTSVQPQQVSSSCATMITFDKAVRGCGAQDNPLGPNAYASYTEARGAYRDVDDNLVRVPAGGFDTTPTTYYETVIAGAAC